MSMYELKEAIEKSCSDFRVIHQRKCKEWKRRFSSHLASDALLMDIGYKHLHSVNYYNSHAHGYEWSGILVGLVGFGMVLIGYV
jgi:hypothetical protein